MASLRHPAGSRLVAGWLLLCALLVWAMVGLGAVTRLTRSGLSIVVWEPIAGALPPLDATDWSEAFAAYRASPEGRIVNPHLDLEAFKRIYLIEWSHRQLGRLTGLVVIVPMFFFWRSGRLRRKQAGKIGMVLALGALQAVIGWYMVTSGLVDVPVVSHVRLAMHLMMAAVIFCGLVWLSLDAFAADMRDHRPAAPPRVVATTLALAGVGLAMCLGALVAGMRAGTVYPTFPTMNGALLPDAITFSWDQLTGSSEGVHTMHRLLALVATVACLGAAALGLARGPSPRERWNAALLAAGVLLQGALGAATVLARVPMGLATLHQLHAFWILALGIGLLHTQLPTAPRR